MNTSVQEVLLSSPNYNFIINYTDNNSDIYFLKLRVWYSDIIYIINNKIIINKLDEVLYNYITDYNFKIYLKKNIRLYKIKITNIYLSKELISYYNLYNQKAMYIINNRWL